MDDRGVSEVLAVLLTTVIVVALVAIVAVPALEGIKPEGQQTHVTASVTVDASDMVTVELTHYGGRTVDLSSATVVATTGQDRLEYTGLSGSFEQGEQWADSKSGSGFEVGENVRVFLLVDGVAVGTWQGTVSAP